MITHESRIRPFRGIRKNVANTKIKYVKGRIFSEDIEEDLLRMSVEGEDSQK